MILLNVQLAMLIAGKLIGLSKAIQILSAKLQPCNLSVTIFFRSSLLSHIIRSAIVFAINAVSNVSATRNQTFDAVFQAYSFHPIFHFTNSAVSLTICSGYDQRRDVVVRPKFLNVLNILDCNHAI
jgi:hypothetical protein